MDLELYQKLDELFNILDKIDFIEEMPKIIKNMPNDITDLVSVYRTNPTIVNKKLLYSNPYFKKYIENETKINYLIMHINDKFHIKENHCESH